MKNYELTCLININFGETEAKNIQEKIISLIQKEGGVLTTEAAAAKKKLASPVKKNDFAFAISFNFQFLPEKLAALEKELKAEPAVLRYLILHRKPGKPGQAPRRPLKMTRKISPKTSGPKVELKEIEKKLKEILDE